MSAVHDVQDATGVTNRHRPFGETRRTGTTVPTDGTAGFAPGCEFINVSTGLVYRNNGTSTSCLFQSVAGTSGAGTIGILDPGNYTTQTTVEGALQELYGTATASTGTIDIPLTSLRLLQADGSVGNIIQNGGLLANDTTPNLARNANGAFYLGFAASNVNKLAFVHAVPPDMDTTAGNLTYTITTKGSGTADTFGANITICVDGGAPISAVGNGTGANTALQNSNVSFVASGNIANGAKTISGNLTPAAHGTDAILIFGLSVSYKKKLSA